MPKAFSYVYLAHHPESGLYKIGRSKDPEARVKSVAMPGEIVHLHLKIRTSSPNWLESYLHKAFAHKSAGGEWFSLEAEDLVLLESVSHVESEEDLPGHINALAWKNRWFAWSPPPEKLTRVSNCTRIKLPAALNEALEKYLASMKCPAKKGAVIDVALREFFGARGYLPAAT